MDFQAIKDIIEKEGGKIVIVEQDKPTLVVMSFEEWRGIKRQKSENPAPAEPAATPPETSKQTGEELTIDDLPL